MIILWASSVSLLNSILLFLNWIYLALYYVSCRGINTSICRWCSITKRREVGSLHRIIIKNMNFFNKSFLKNVRLWAWKSNQCLYVVRCVCNIFTWIFLTVLYICEKHVHVGLNKNAYIFSFEDLENMG